MWLMETLLISGCTNQRGAGQFGRKYHKLFVLIFNERTDSVLTGTSFVSIVKRLLEIEEDRCVDHWNLPF